MDKYCNWLGCFGSVPLELVAFLLFPLPLPLPFSFAPFGSVHLAIFLPFLRPIIDRRLEVKIVGGRRRAEGDERKGKGAGGRRQRVDEGGGGRVVAKRGKG